MSCINLSAKELMKFFNGPISELPQRGGPKEYAPDGSWLQNKTIEFARNQRTQVLTEERVKKKGHLAHGEWKPDLGKVEIIGKVGKFWQITGHVEGGRYLLYPEEALSLVDKGDIEVYYGGLPLSLQECYPTLLHDRVPIEHYQVYNHLARLGFVVFRHQPVEKLTKYERNLGISRKPCEESRSRRKKKRKANKEKEQEGKMVKTGEIHVQADSDLIRDGLLESSSMKQESITSHGHNMDVDDNKTVNPDHSLEDSVAAESASLIRPFRHFNNESIDVEPLKRLNHSDFSSIKFPSLYPGSVCLLEKPNSQFLPSGISLEKDSYILQAPRYTPAPRHNADDDLEFSHPSAVQRSKVIAQNWTELKKQLQDKTDLLMESPVGHLWTGDIKPLIKPSKAFSTVSLLDRMKLIQNVNFNEDTDCFPQTTTSKVQIIYDVYKPDASFSKTDPGPPAFRLCIVRQDEPCVGLADFVQASKMSCDRVPLQWAVVDNGDISFYSFNGINLPADVTLK